MKMEVDEADHEKQYCRVIQANYIKLENIEKELYGMCFRSIIFGLRNFERC